MIVIAKVQPAVVSFKNPAAVGHQLSSKSRLD